MGRENCTTGLSPVGKPYNRPGGRGNAPLLVAGATTFPPAGGLYSSLCVELTKRGFAVFYSAPLNRGQSGAARIGGAAQRLITRMLIMLYDTESQSRNADFISIAP